MRGRVGARLRGLAALRNSELATSYRSGRYIGYQTAPSQLGPWTFRGWVYLPGASELEDTRIACAFVSRLRLTGSDWIRDVRADGTTEPAHPWSQMAAVCKGVA